MFPWVPLFPTDIPKAHTWGFPKIRGTVLGVPIIRIIVYGDLYWGPLNPKPYTPGNYHITSLRMGATAGGKVDTKNPA